MNTVSTFLVLLFSSSWSMFIQRDDTYASQINLNDAEYKQINTFQSTSGVTKYKSQQQYQGIDLFGAILVTEETDDNKLSPVAGYYFDPTIIKQDTNDDLTPLITEENALQIGIEYYIPDGDKTSLFGYEYGESERTTKINLNLFKDEEYNINEWVLSYIVLFSFKDPLSDDVYRPFIVINAKTGDIIYTLKQLLSQSGSDWDAWGTGGNAKVGPERHGPMYITEAPYVRNSRCEVYSYPLVGSNNEKLGECDPSPTSSICEIIDVEVNTAPNCIADAYMWANTVFNLYDDWGPRNRDTGNPIPPLAENNLPLKFYVHWGTDYENAFYSGGAMYFGDGANRFYPLVSLDVAAHEVAHGFTDQGSGLLYRDQSGGINEAYSDLAGEAGEAYYRGEDTVTWTTGMNIYKREDPSDQWCLPNCALRYMYDPPLDTNSIDHISNYYNGMNVHYSSGIFNSAFHNLSSMATLPVFRWSTQEIFLLTSQANYYYWGPFTNFDAGLCGMIGAVEDVFIESDWQRKKQDLIDAFQVQGVKCETNMNAKGSGSPGSSIPGNNSNNQYYIYGGIAAALFVIFIIATRLYIKKRNNKILLNQLNATSIDNPYGSVVSGDERA